MIQRSLSLERRLEAETVRHAGSLARFVCYRGQMPLRCELVADGERMENRAAYEALVRSLVHGAVPTLPEGATYWRLIDNNGNVIMQGTADGEP